MLKHYLLFQLIYNGHYDKAINYAQAVWRPLKKSENLINYPEHPFVNTLYIKDLQECYLASLEHKNFDKDAFLDKIVSMGFDEDKGQIDKVIDTLKSDLPLGDIKDGLLIKPQEQLLILNIHFLKYMYNTYQMPFIFSEWLWNIIATTSIFGKQKGAENWFYVDCATLDQHIAEKYDTFFSANQLELFGQVWGLDFVFEFLHSSKLLSDEHYHNMLENISFLKNEMIRIVGINLWQMQFVKNWPNANNSSVDPSLQPLFDDSFNLEDDDAIERINSYSSKAPVSERAQDELKKGKNKRNKENDYEPLPLLNDDWGSEEYQKKEPVINTEPKVPVINTEPKVSVINTEPKVGRNEPCPCGSGKKYKKCCLNK
ncbi:MAG: SEC-C metal-binding domain-containing protein [Bacteroidia bacterium]